MLKRLINIFLILVIMLSAGCSESARGIKEMEEVKSNFTGFKSAYVSVTDMKKNIQELNCSYRFEGNVMTYFFMRADKKSFYLEHNNGKKLSKAAKGDVNWTEFISGDSEFYQYTKSDRHKYISEKLMFFDPLAVEKSEIISAGSSFQINLFYDTDKMSEDFMDYFANFGITGKLSDFYSVYLINNNDNIIRIDHFGKIDGNGIHYRIEIENINAVSEIKRPNLHELTGGRS